MGPKKKGGKASGDAAKGEKVFKNLCGVCHSLSVSNKLLFSNYVNYRLTLSDQLLEVSAVVTLPQVKGLTIHHRCHLKLH